MSGLAGFIARCRRFCRNFAKREPPRRHDSLSTRWRRETRSPWRRGRRISIETEVESCRNVNSSRPPMLDLFMKPRAPIPPLPLDAFPDAAADLPLADDL